MFLLVYFWFYVAICLDFARGFSFTTSGSPFQCEDLTISWTGGTPPFHFIIVVIYAVNINISIPSDAFNDNKGTFTAPLHVAAGTEIMLSMSDATGPLSGGTSDVLTVGDRQMGKSCNTTSPANDFFFSTDETLEQCKPYPFTSYDGAVLPLTIYGYIPGGHDSFVLNPPSEPSYTWIANLKAQTHVAFMVIDSRGRFGGTEKLFTVAPSNNSSCITTGTITSSSQSISTLSPSSSTVLPPSDPKNTPGTGAIIGIAIAGAIVGIILVALVWCWRRRFTSNRPLRNIDLTEAYPVQSFADDTSDSERYSDPLRPSHSHVGLFNRGSNTSLPGLTPAGSSKLVTTGFETTPTSGSVQLTYIVHRDIQDVIPLPIELPPQYSEGRAPIQGLSQHPGPIVSTSLKLSPRLDSPSTNSSKD